MWSCSQAQANVLYLFPDEKQKPGSEAQVTLVACTLCITMAIFESAQGKYCFVYNTYKLSTRFVHVTKYTVIPFSTDVLQFGYLQCFCICSWYLFNLLLCFTDHFQVPP